MPIDLTKRYLEAADGRTASVTRRAPGPGATVEAVWHVRQKRFFIRTAPTDAVTERPSGWADVRLDLDVGVFRFRAWLRPTAIPGRWEVLPDQRIDVKQCRRGIRAPFGAALAVQPLGAATAEAGTGRDLSTSGLGFTAEGAWEPGTLVRVHARGLGPLLESGLTLGLVRRDGPQREGQYVYGGRFVDLVPVQREELAHTVLALLHRADGPAPERAPGGPGGPLS